MSVVQPKLLGELIDTAEPDVKISESFPFVDREPCGLGDGDEDTDRDGAANLDTSHGHEAEVAVVGEVAVRGEEFGELFAAFDECAEGDG